MSRRILEQLNTTKQKKVDVLRGFPNPAEGVNGEIQIRITNSKGLMLFVRANNSWYSTSLSSMHIGPNDERVILEQGRYPKFAGEIAMNNDGNITYKQTGDGDTLEIVESAGTYASLRAQATTQGDVGLGSVTNKSEATMFTNSTISDSSGTTTINGQTTNMSGSTFTSLYSDTNITGNSLVGATAHTDFVNISQTLNADDTETVYDHYVFKLNARTLDTTEFRNVYLMDLQAGDEDDGVDNTSRFSVKEDGSVACGAIDTGSSAITTTGTISGGTFVGAPIWREFPFIISATAAGKYYFRDVDDLFGDYRKWDAFDTTPTSYDYRSVGGTFIVPENCTLVGMAGEVTNHTNATDDAVVSIYVGTPNEAASNTTLQVAEDGSGSDVITTINTDLRYAPHSFTAIFDHDLTAGDMVVPMISKTGVGVSTPKFIGSLTLKFVTR